MRFVLSVLLCIAIANAITVPAATQEQSVRDLIGRVFGEVCIDGYIYSIEFTKESGGAND